MFSLLSCALFFVNLPLSLNFIWLILWYVLRIIVWLLILNNQLLAILRDVDERIKLKVVLALRVNRVVVFYAPNWLFLHLP